MQIDCTLCGSPSAFYFQDTQRQWTYLHCATCDLHFLDPRLYLTPSEELSRYRLHRNNPQDVGYQAFVRPLVQKILDSHSPSDRGLDFGCGENSGLGHQLKQAGYAPESYDLYFAHRPELLVNDYDFIAAVEVIEHFHRPGEEFKKLRQMIRPGGHLGAMTQFFSADRDFATWHYRRDPTHVCFYSMNTLEWIRDRFSFQRLETGSERVAWWTA